MAGDNFRNHAMLTGARKQAKEPRLMSHLIQMKKIENKSQDCILSNWAVAEHEGDQGRGSQITYHMHETKRVRQSDSIRVKTKPMLKTSGWVLHLVPYVK